MPKVVVSKSKGLVQQTGEGFELQDVILKPGVETLGAGVTEIVAVASTLGSLDAKFFDISSTAKNFRVYFDVDTSGNVPAADGRVLVEVDLGAGTVADTVVASAIETALEAADGGDDFEVVVTGAKLEIACKGEGSRKSPFSAGDSGFTLNSETVGLTTATLSKKIIICNNVVEGLSADGEAAHLAEYSLPVGEYAGQEVILLRTDNNAGNVEVNATFHTEDMTHAADKALFVNGSTKPRVLHCIWSGTAWIPMSAGLSANGKGGVTGLDS